MFSYKIKIAIKIQKAMANTIRWSEKFANKNFFLHLQLND